MHEEVALLDHKTLTLGSLFVSAVVSWFGLICAPCKNKFLLVLGSLLYPDSNIFSTGFARKRDVVFETVQGFIASPFTTIGLCTIPFEGMVCCVECTDVNEE